MTLNTVTPQPTDDHARNAARLCRSVSSWYVRRDSKFYDVHVLDKKLSKDDVQRACLYRFKEAHPDIPMSPALIRDVFKTSIDLKHTTVAQSIPCWNGSTECKPAVEGRCVWKRGMVSVNSWISPVYRSIVPEDVDTGVAQEFLEAIFTRETERNKFLDWLAWCLQNEDKKPNWAPFLYSASKGTGKSTLCRLVARLFGTENSVTQNGVDKLTSRFNVPVLTSKLVISEELVLKQDSPQSNALKTYLTETETLSERKGAEPEMLEQVCCFLFTSNHLPLWIEPEDRRYYLIDVDHEGHAAGPRAAEFASLVSTLAEAMEDDRFIHALWKQLMERKPAEGFSAKTLNVITDATPLMTRVQGASETTVKSLFRDLVAERGVHALPEAEVARIVAEDLKANINITKHLMPDLGWSKKQVKWDGCAYARSLWVEEGFWVTKGKVYGPGGYVQPLVEHFERATPVLLDEDVAAPAAVGDLY